VALWVAAFVLEEGGADGEGGYGSGFGAEDAGAEGYGVPGVVGEELHLVGGPTAFRADGEGDALMGGCVQSGGDGVVLFGFSQQEFGGGCYFLQCGF